MFNFTSGATGGAEKAASEVVAPVVAENCMYLGAQDFSPVQEVAPPVRAGGGVGCNKNKNFCVCF